MEGSTGPLLRCKYLLTCALTCLQAPTVGTNGATSTEQVRIAVLGASGYTGEEVVRLLALHPNFSVAALTGESQAGKASARWTPCWHDSCHLQHAMIISMRLRSA